MELWIWWGSLIKMTLCRMIGANLKLNHNLTINQTLASWETFRILTLTSLNHSCKKPSTKLSTAIKIHLERLLQLNLTTWQRIKVKTRFKWTKSCTILKPWKANRSIFKMSRLRLLTFRQKSPLRQLTPKRILNKA